jgi:oligoendopeptidase F
MDITVWGSLYTMIASSLKAKINLDGKEQELSMGQLQNRLSHPDPKIRKMLMETWEKAWESVEDQIAHSLESTLRISLKSLQTS